MLIDGPSLDAPAPPLDDLLRIGLEAAPEAPALVSAERSMSWRELEEESERLAGGYRALGLEPGDRVASLMPNRVALLVHYLACFKAGLVVTPLNYRYTHREIDHALEVSGARALLAHEERGEDVGASKLAAALPTSLTYPGDFERLLESEPLADGPHPDLSEPAAIFFTSGSTGPAKGVTHTRTSLRWMIASAAAAFELDADDVFLPGSSMSHVDCLRVCRCGSDKVSTELLHEVEGALVDHPAVDLAGAVGVHDEVHGENVRAYVTLREGAERPSAADLIVHCRERIGYKAPEEILFLDEMPLNPTGKIDRTGLKRMAEDHLHPHGLE